MDKSTAWQNKVTFFNLPILNDAEAVATKRRVRASFILNGEVRIRPILCLKMESYEWCRENNRFQIGQEDRNNPKQGSDSNYRETEETDDLRWDYKPELSQSRAKGWSWV